MALRAGRLVRVLPDARTQPFELSLYYARRKLLPPRVKVFIEHVLATVPDRLQRVLRGD
jgi:DNA-binding transcriptional LysR family regulator